MRYIKYVAQSYTTESESWVTTGASRASLLNKLVSLYNFTIVYIIQIFPLVDGTSR